MEFLTSVRVYGYDAPLSLSSLPCAATISYLDLGSNLLTGPIVNMSTWMPGLTYADVCAGQWSRLDKWWTF